MKNKGFTEAEMRIWAEVQAKLDVENLKQTFMEMKKQATVPIQMSMNEINFREIRDRYYVAPSIMETKKRKCEEAVEDYIRDMAGED